MKTIYFDCAMGAAGDMLTGALLELHPDPEGFLHRINEALAGKALISAGPDSKCGISGTHVSVVIDGDQEGEETHHHHHASIGEMRAHIGAAALPEQVRQDALEVFNTIAEAESAVHGCPMENVHFHELGSLDALADVMAVSLLIYELAPDKIIASPVNVGSGTVKCAHGILPVPAPATERILRGLPVYAGDVRGELCTPTGAALLRHFASEFGRMPVMRVGAVGYGTGTKDFPAANIVRAMLGETESTADRALLLCCNLDDMTPEALGFAMEELFSQGALDVYFTAIGMKKSRPAVMLSCICRPEQREEMLRCIFKNTSTLGVRELPCDRYCLQRDTRTVDSGFGQVRIKTARGWGVCREKAEYEDLARIARARAVPLSQVQTAIAHK